MNNHRTSFVKTFQNVEEQVSSRFNAQILEFCESELFLETIQKSEVTSSSNRCYDEQSSYTTSLSFLLDITKCSTLVENATNTTTDTPTTNDFSLNFEEDFIENDISIISNTSHITNHQYPLRSQDQFDISMLQNEIHLAKNFTTFNDPMFGYPHALSNDHVVPKIEPTSFPTFCVEDDTSSISPFKSMRMNDSLSPNYSFVDSSITSYFPRSSVDFGTFDGNSFLGNDIQTCDQEFQGDNNGIFSIDPLLHSYSSNELNQVLSDESQYLVNRGGSSTTPMKLEITSLESETFRTTNKLTSQERKEKINKYLKKRNQRNFSKKIKYACRKTLADSRPRIRGRFVKNNEFGENITTNNHEEYRDGDVLKCFGDQQTLIY